MDFKLPFASIFIIPPISGRFDGIGVKIVVDRTGFEPSGCLILVAPLYLIHTSAPPFYFRESEPVQFVFVFCGTYCLSHFVS